ncbi:phosphoglycerate kinase [Candidatus Palibaumannia cicadellinicola]|uniref:Phosphoglycerate kinase n=1 Tax=Baumannia cicadellinicola subsp. Homalodisca coagulata TaxID=374463 RepID=PGK_BAUCH|nr:phosphoglycerate kinase [Candidatus Baumannia cicadellinicola]Q1LSJ6.1 RecName: Full=Phosphoglycerate kinase [Baumannia cicadellinicola str. Hc (Homalodisca coagulata)]ABF13794.1 phosphoglycerate kinase [Baumannia cicadellinicola str. Hc (Homalodisca coagulata)]MCJ7461982.1 phosphoglycerate kinase [Candidatus Baumannia cicadellinicola]
MAVTKITDLNLKNKRVLIRADLNVPIKDGQITSYARINASLPTIITVLKQGAASVMVTSHLGRPTEGQYDENLSLYRVVNYLQQKISIPVRLIKDYLNGISFTEKQLLVLENVRFNKGETKNDETLAKQYAALCDIFIMDAFGTAHRAHASTYGIAKYAPLVCAGLLLYNELEVLSKALNQPVRPMVAIVGGSKVSTKLMLLNKLSKISDHLIVGGGIANTFLAAQGYNVGQSLLEPNLINKAKQLLKYKNILLPTDVRVSQELDNAATLKHIREVGNNEKIFDIGDESANRFAKILQQAKTILWNGPVGAFELTHFRQGTKILANAIVSSNAFSIAGGGDTLAAIDYFNLNDKISYLSTGGGAFLSFIEGKTLPAVAMLIERNKNN